MGAENGDSQVGDHRAFKADQRHALFDRVVSKGLTRTLLFWFLLLSLLPLMVVSWVSYQQSAMALRNDAIHTMTQRTVMQSDFIKTWFDFRFRDLQVQAENKTNGHFLQLLQQGLENSGKAPGDFVGSIPWTRLVEAHKADLVRLPRIYDYYQDLFLIDRHGNILFSAENKADLGTNLLTGPYKDTRFAATARQSLESGQALFSDLELYAPSKNIAAGFLTAPLIDENGSKIGLFAIQLDTERINFVMANSSNVASSQTSYLVGSDRLLRTAISAEGGSDVLRKRVDFQNIERVEHAEHLVRKGSDFADHHEVVNHYIGPNAVAVFGVQNAINIRGIEWLLIAEIDAEEALMPAFYLARLILLLIAVMVFIVAILAVSTANRVVSPLRRLVEVSQAVADGQFDQQVEFRVDNEIGELFEAFNEMLNARQDFEIDLLTSNKQTQKALDALAEQRFALDQHAIVAVTDAAGTINYVNAKFSEISGYSEEELIGQNHRLLNSGHHSKMFFHEMYRTLAAGKTWHAEICNKNKNGEIYWVDSTMVPFMGSDGKPQSYIAIRADITSRKNAELENENSLALLEAILNSTDNGTIVTSHNQKNRRANQRFYDLWCIPDDLIASGDEQAMVDLVKDQLLDPEAFVQYVELFVEDDPSATADTLEFKDGRVYERSSLPMVLNGKVEGRVWNYRDVTARNEAEAALLRARDEADMANRSKSDFLANMSHEIRTPMNGVLGMLNLLESGELSAKQQHQAKLARTSAEALLSLINDILDFSKIEAGKLELETIDFDLRQMLGDMAESMALQAQGKGLELILDVSQVKQSRVKGDPGRIRQLMVNIVGNAIKFTAVGEIIIRVGLEDVGESGTIIYGSVSDTGIGISEEKLATLFDSFSQVDASTTRHYGGTGLGLSICKRLCELMNGGLTVGSTLGEGSRFEFCLTLEHSDQAVIVKPSVDISGERILVVDDNATNREVLSEQLVIWGAEVTEVVDGAAALSIMQQNVDTPFAVAIIDMQMPSMDGAALGAAIREQKRFDPTRMIMMTSMDERGDAQFFADLGFDAYFPKPTTTSDLFDALAVVIDGGSALQAAQPLVTHHYLNSLEPKLFADEDAEELTDFPEVREQETKVLKILLVEDNKINQYVALGILEGMNYTADVANHGAEALERLQNSPRTSPYEMIFMDCQMPVLDGYATTGQIREGKAGDRYCDIPIIAMTANAMEGDREKCIAAGMSDYLSKPIDPNLLEKKLVLWADNRRTNECVAPIAGVLSDVEDMDDSAVATREIPTAEAKQNETSHTAEPESGEKLIWDKAAALNRVRGQEKFMVSLIELFLKDMPDRVSELGQAVEQSNFDSVASLAHATKGVAGNMSGDRLYQLVAKMELAAKQKNSDVLHYMWPDFLEQYELLTEVFQQYMSGSRDELAVVTVDRSRLPELIQNLAEKLQESSYVSRDEIEYLSTCFTDGPEQVLFAELTERVSQFDMVAALQSLEKIAALKNISLSVAGV